MDTPILTLPLDESGVAATHLKQETYPVDPERFYLVYPSWGPFYTDSVVLVDDKGNELKPNLDWEPFLPYQAASLETGQQVHRALIVKVHSVKSVDFKRQVVGGKYGNSHILFDDLLKEYKQKKSKILWDEIIKVDKYMPVDHPHHVDDMKGTHDMVHAIGEMTEMLRWYLTGRLIEIDNVVGLRDELTELSSRTEGNRQDIAQLNDGIRTINSTLEAHQKTHTNLDSKIKANANKLTTHSGHLNTHATAINNLNSKTSQNKDKLNEHTTRFNEMAQEIGSIRDSANTLGYGRGILSASNNTIERLHQVTVYDKLIDSTTQHIVNHERFLTGDSLIINVPLLGDYTTTFFVSNGSMILPNKEAGESQTLKGNGNIEMRYLGNRVFQIMGLR